MIFKKVTGKDQEFKGRRTLTKLCVCQLEDGKNRFLLCYKIYHLKLQKKIELQIVKLFTLRKIFVDKSIFFNALQHFFYL